MRLLRLSFSTITYSVSAQTDKMQFIAIRLQRNLNSFVVHTQHFPCSVTYSRLTATLQTLQYGRGAWAPAGFFFRGGQWGSMKDGSPPAGSRGSSPVGVAPPEADDIFSKWCINTSSTEVLDNICRKKTLFSISRGQVPPCPCLRAPMEGRERSEGPSNIGKKRTDQQISWMRHILRSELNVQKFTYWLRQQLRSRDGGTCRCSLQCEFEVRFALRYCFLVSLQSWIIWRYI